MKAAIVLLAVLIIGSNAQINTNATAAVAQANELLNSFQNQTSQNINATADTINANLGEIAKVFVDLSQNLTGLKQGRSSNSAAQIQSVIILITGLNLGIPDANALLAPVIANLASQIAVLVNPTIDTLGSAITNGTTTLSCFTNEVPKIAENIAEAVAFVANVVLTDTSKVVKIVTGFVDSLRAQANDILVEAQKCPGGLIGELLCLPPLVAKFNALVLSAPLQLAAKIPELTQAVQNLGVNAYGATASEVEKRVPLIAQDITNCV